MPGQSGCFVPYCDTGRKGCTEKRTMFSVPKVTTKLTTKSSGFVTFSFLFLGYGNAGQVERSCTYSPQRTWL